MTEIAYRNGSLIPATELTVDPRDTGFLMGVTVSERLRTFSGRLFRTDRHFDRLRRSLEIVGLQCDLEPVQNAIDELTKHNHALLPPGHDLGLTIFATPGTAQTPTICMHSEQLPFATWSEKYHSGQRLVTSSVRQVPTSCWPAELKCRSRMHYYLADNQARQTDPRARALLLDQDGFVAEASTASILMYREDEGLLAPPQEKVLPSVSVATIRELAAELGLGFSHRDIRHEELTHADEVLLCSTSPCVLPVVSIDGHSIGDGRPGAVFSRLIRQWSSLVGLDIAEQARQCAALSP